MDMTPLTWFDTLWFSSLTFLILFLLGYAVAHILQRCFKRKKKGVLPFTPYKFSFPTLLVFYLGLGMITLTFMLTVLLLFPGPFLWKVIFLMALVFSLFVYSLYNRIKKCGLTISQRVKKLNQRWIFNLIIIVVTLYGIYHFVKPAIGLYAYPGGDVIPRAFYSNVIINTGKLPVLGSQYPYTSTPYLPWEMQAMPLLGGFFSIVYSTSIAKAHLFFIQFNRGLTPLFVYAFVEILLKNRELFSRQFCGLCSMIGAIFSFAQYRYFFWGGIGESIGFNVALVLLMSYLLLKINVTKRTSSYSILKQTAIYFGFFVCSFGIMVYASFRVVPLFITALLSLILVEFIQKEREKLTRALALFIVIGAMYGGVLLGIHFDIHPIFSRLDPFAYSSSSKLILVESGSLQRYIYRSLKFIHHFHGNYILPFLELGVVSIALHTKKKNEDAYYWYPFFACVFLFLFSQNALNALYHFPYPGIKNMQNPTRIYYLFLVPFSMLAGIGGGLAIISTLNLCKKVTKAGYDRVRSLSPQNSINLSFQGIFGVFLFFSMILSLFMYAPYARQEYQHYMYWQIERRKPVVTANDLKAFQWTQRNIPGRKRFLTSGYDTGKWLPIYTDHIALLPQALRLSSPQEEKFDTLVSLLLEGTINRKVMNLLKEFSIDYIYVGLVQGFPPRYPGTFDRDALNETFSLVFQAGKVMIFNVKQLSRDL